MMPQCTTTTPQASLPASSGFPGASLAVVHTPAAWGPQDIYGVTTQVHPEEYNTKDSVGGTRRLPCSSARSKWLLVRSASWLASQRRKR